MGARHKLNQAYVTGAVILGLLSWLVTQSAIVFWVALLSSLALSLRAGGIRVHDRISWDRHSPRTIRSKDRLSSQRRD